MPVITISRGSYSKGKEISEKLAEALGYECISREILLEASQHFNIPEVKLVRAIHDAPSVFDRFSYGKESYIAFFREALLEHIKKDNVVYHGLGGHFFLAGVPHVLRVRIIANMEDRIKEEMKRENISKDKARYLLQKDDEERRKWSLQLYGVDTWNSKLYDVVLHIDKLKVDDAVELLVNAVKRPCFQTTPESREIFEDLLLAAKVQLSLVFEFPSAIVSSKDRNVHIGITAPLSQQRNIIKKASELVENVPGVENIEIYIVPIVTQD